MADRRVADCQSKLQLGTCRRCQARGLQPFDATGLRLEVDVDAMVVQPEARDRAHGGGRRRKLPAGSSDRRDHDIQLLQELDRRARGRGPSSWPRGHRRARLLAGAAPERDTLVERLPRDCFVDEPEAERRGIRLERRVGPVALILHLELVALEGERRRHVRGELHVQAVPGAREREIDPADQTLREDRPRKLPRGAPARGRRPIATADVGIRRMKDAETDPAVAKGPAGDARHRVGQRSVHAPLDSPAPLELDLPGRAERTERDQEGVLAPLDAEVGDHRRDRAPGLVAHGDLDQPGKLDLATRDVREVDPAEDGGKRARAHGDLRRLGRSRGTANECRSGGRLGRRRRHWAHRASPNVRSPASRVNATFCRIAI